MSRALLYWNTVRHLKARQIVNRLWRGCYRPAPDLSSAPPRRPITGDWCEPIRQTPSMTGPSSFVLFNQPGTLDTGWDDPARARLWRYNLHYFDDLNAQDATTRRDWHIALIKRWIDENSPGHGTGWEPYPTALRMVNWIKAALGGLVLPDEAVDSLAVQARWLSRRVEYHLMGNHLIADAKALCFAGLFFEGREAASWLRSGSRLLRREIEAQILADGGHFELSPMYHALVLEDLLDVANLIAAYDAGPALPRLAANIDRSIAPMQRWLATMSHPDGEIGFFNDAAIGIAAKPVDLERYAEALGHLPVEDPVSGVTHLSESGYVRLSDRKLTLIADVAQVGPAHQPGHAHADTLSFELSVGHHRVFVNGGTSEYGLSAERARQRATAAHNTVVVEQRSSSEVWSGFRVARRARPGAVTINMSDGLLRLAGSHDGYRHLPGRPIHQRQWRIEDGRLTIADRIAGRAINAVAFFHLSPGLHFELDGVRGVVRDGNAILLEFEILHGLPSLHVSSHHPRFGVSQATQSLQLALDHNRSAVAFRPFVIAALAAEPAQITPCISSF